MTIPPGDSRDDDPPSIFWHLQGKNFYYQGIIDNCAIGGLGNAIFWMIGQEAADQLLQFEMPEAKLFWNKFVIHIQKTLPSYRVQRIKCNDILLLDDSSPFNAQPRHNDFSESHAICFFDDCIFDSASRYVLKKNRSSLEWCSGTFGSQSHLCMYQLQKKESQTKDLIPFKKKKRFRYT